MNTPNTPAPMKSRALWTRQEVKEVPAPQTAADLKWLFSRENVGGQPKWFVSAVYVIGKPQPGQPMPPRLTTKILLSDAEAAAIEAALAPLFGAHAAQLQAQFLSQQPS